MKTMVVLLGLSLLATCSSRRPMPGEGEEAIAITKEQPEFYGEVDFVQHEGYCAVYNHTTLCPDWVAWELTREETEGQLDGQYSFSRDPDVDFPKASREDYANSGWDKGHLAPRADMRWSQKALEESYYFTNICPQDHTMNSGAWRKIEELCRRVARRDSVVYIVCGPIYDSDEPRTIGPAGVHVPDRFFKALALETAEGTQTVGFIVSNTPQQKSPRHYAVTVDSIEAVTDYDLFPWAEEEAEASFDWEVWGRK